MLELKNITKIYVNKKDTTKNVTALKDVNISFPRQGFVCLLGPSGCGKTTLLNILGGLDTSYSGELIVNNIATKIFKPKDWDSYRNNHVGFVFQEYNLIPHQTVSKNVELVLTIAGASSVEIKEKSKRVLKDVGLEDKFLNLPNKLSGGQKQRVAIARALVNNPEVILADEPTSALDSATSIQVMNILKEISQKKLVIMVTHNEELAKKYSSRIIRILDGKVQSDEDLEKNAEKEDFLKKMPQSYKYGKSKMKIKTAAALSFKNLMAKKRRTFLTILAGSIGIISLSIILGIIRGSTNFAKDLYKEAFPQPIEIKREQPIFSSFSEMQNVHDKVADELKKEEENAKGSTKIRSSKKMENNVAEILSKSTNKVHKNNLDQNFKNHMLDFLKAKPNSIKAIALKRLPKINYLTKLNNQFSFNDKFVEMPYSNDLNSIYELVGSKSRWPEKKDEVVVSLNQTNNLDDRLLKVFNIKEDQEVDCNNLIGKTIGSFVPHNELYKKQGEKFKSLAELSQSELENCFNSAKAVKLKVVGFIKPKIEVSKKKLKRRGFAGLLANSPIKPGVVAFTHELGDYIENTTKNSEVVKAQKNSKEDVTTSAVAKNSNSLLTPNQMLQEKQKSVESLLTDLGYSDVFDKMRIFINDPIEDQERVLEQVNKFNSTKNENSKILVEKGFGNYKETATEIRKMCLFLLFTIGAAALISSLIMVALLTFISVLERTKEIGVLRSIGARKKDISRLFKSEAAIIGFFTGLFGGVVSFLISIPLNLFIKKAISLEGKHSLIKVDILIFAAMMLFSLVVTLLAGLIPAKIASRKDPVKILTGTSN